MATIRKRNNRYQLIAFEGYRSDGAQIKRVTTWKIPEGWSEARAEKEAQKQAVLFEEKVKFGRYGSGNIKFQDFADDWLEHHAKTQLRDRTYYRYLEMSKRAYKHFGHRRLDQIRVSHLQDFITALGANGENKRTGKGLSPKTIKNYLSFVSAVLQRAVELEMIPDNPCRKVRPPKDNQKEIRYMTEEETQNFVGLLQNESLEHRVVLLLLLLTGMRRGELLGLEWPDIDFDRKVLSIRRTSQYASQKGTFTDQTKTVSSMRSLPLSADLAALLREYQNWQSERIRRAGEAWVPEWQKHPRLFTQWNGVPMFNNTPYRILENFLKKHGLPHISLHSLRHTNATLLVSAGVDIRSVSAMLGHAQTSTTLNVYAHAINKTQAAAAENLAAMLLRKREEKHAEKPEKSPENGPISGK